MATSDQTHAVCEFCKGQADTPGRTRPAMKDDPDGLQICEACNAHMPGISAYRLTLRADRRRRELLGDAAYPPA